MSPSLFILCMEYLSRLLTLRTTSQRYYHPLCINLRITHLAFADDLMLFGRGDLVSMQVLADAMGEFSECSGLEVNREKSNIFIAGAIAARQRANIINVFGFPVAELPVKYLGIPLASKMLKTTDYSQLIEKMSTTVKKWKGKSLSFAGRLELIRSCIQGVESYWLQAFPLIGTVISRIVAIARQFLWGSKNAYVAWKDVFLPKDEEGLGLRDFEAWNSVLHAKILWNIFVKKDSLWIKWIHTEIIRGVDFCDWTPRTKQDSTLIKHLFSIRDEMLGKCPRQEVATLLTKWNNPSGTREAYDWFRPRGERRFWAKFVWKDFIPPRQSFITWLALRGRLLTRDRIRQMVINKSCAICESHDESIDHLFFKCSETKRIWDDIREWIGLRRNITAIRSAIKWTAVQQNGICYCAKS